VFVLGALVRLIGVERPIDLPSWRECDEASIARNYVREGMNLFYPRIDWRRDGPGFAEMEFPLYPWTAAVLYKAFGIHEVIPRLISWALSLVSLLAFCALARRLLPEWGVLGACLFFALSPLSVLIGHSIQPEGLMFCAYLVAAYAFVRWLDTDEPRYFLLAMAATALAILGKAPAAHIGLFFAALLLTERGLRVLRTPYPWVFAFDALLPGILWYRHAYVFWRVYGNSLGVSNEDHWAGMDLFTNPRLVGGIIGLDMWYVWTLPGLVVALYGLLSMRRQRVARVAGLWLISIFLYYLVAARTLSGLWASYYHVVAVPAVALLFGCGVASLREASLPRRWLRMAIAISSVVVLAAWLAVVKALPQLAPSIAFRIAGPPLPLWVSATLLAGAAWLAWTLVAGQKGLARPWATLAAACLCPVFYLQANLLIEQARFAGGRELYETARQLAPLVPSGASIASIGGYCIGPTGKPAAADASYMFYWFDRKGFAICREKLSIGALEDVAARGAQYFVAEKDAVRLKPGFDAELRQHFALAGEADAATLYRLR
jgi:4-amino-4-deoxy-L-arabinose transferase-like glycosyltransferase